MSYTYKKCTFPKLGKITYQLKKKKKGALTSKENIKRRMKIIKENPLW